MQAFITVFSRNFRTHCNPRISVFFSAVVTIGILHFICPWIVCRKQLLLLNYAKKSKHSGWEQERTLRVSEYFLFYFFSWLQHVTPAYANSLQNASTASQLCKNHFEYKQRIKTEYLIFCLPQDTPASCLWLQWTSSNKRAWHSPMFVSLPLQCTFPMVTSPSPSPNNADL